MRGSDEFMFVWPIWPSYFFNLLPLKVMTLIKNLLGTRIPSFYQKFNLKVASIILGYHQLYEPQPIVKEYDEDRLQLGRRFLIFIKKNAFKSNSNSYCMLYHAALIWRHWKSKYFSGWNTEVEQYRLNTRWELLRLWAVSKFPLSPLPAW